MPCYHPIQGWRSVHPNSNGNYYITFKPGEGLIGLNMSVPCGQCIGCRLERSRQWAVRCVHEASLYSSNCFITLTLDNLHLLPNGSLDLKLFQDFMKRLRFRFGSGIRFFHCGEYGEQFGRPHYHACLFNFDFPDKAPWRETHDGHKVWKSKALSELWPHGLSEIGSVTFESAAYVARYITKKVTGQKAYSHYSGRKPEYVTMSRRPGIGKGWFDKFSSDVFPSDQVALRGRLMRPPKYYDRQFELVYPDDSRKLKRTRRVKRRLVYRYEPEARLLVREEVHLLTFKLLKRGYENG